MNSNMQLHLKHWEGDNAGKTIPNKNKSIYCDANCFMALTIIYLFCFSICKKCCHITFQHTDKQCQSLRFCKLPTINKRSFKYRELPEISIFLSFINWSVRTNVACVCVSVRHVTMTVDTYENHAGNKPYYR